MRATHIWRNSFAATQIFFVGLAVFSAAKAQAPIYSNDIHINEFIPNPVGDDAALEFIELYNNSDVDADISGWIIDTGGSSHFTIGAATILPARGFIVFFSAQKPISLTNTSDRIKLLLPDGATIKDYVSYSSSKEGYSYNWIEGSSYEQSSTPTPGSSNVLDPTPTPIITPTPSLVPSPTPVVTPSASPSIAYSEHIKINEFMPNPVGDDTKLEFIELINNADEPIDISGWGLDDTADGGSGTYMIPSDTVLQGDEFIVFYSSQTKISLNNDSDHVRLLDPNGDIRDDQFYDSSQEGYSYNRTDAPDFEQSKHATPGERNIIENPTPTPRSTVTPKPTTIPRTYDFSEALTINELLPRPATGGSIDEFVEIKNNENRRIYLYRWSIDDMEKGSKPHVFKEDEYIGPHGFLVIPKIDSRIAFNDDEDDARLIDPTGKIISRVHYEKPPLGKSLSKAVDGTFVWSDVVTPGKENIISVHNEISTPKPSTKPTSKKQRTRVAGTVRVSSAGEYIPPNLPWTTAMPALPPALFSVSGNVMPIGYAHARRNIFIFFGAATACSQLAWGIHSKEQIWRRRG